jgi:hypothetical protein
MVVKLWSKLVKWSGLGAIATTRPATTNNQPVKQSIGQTINWSNLAILGVEGRAAGQHLEDEDAQRPPIHALLMVKYWSNSINGQNGWTGQIGAQLRSWHGKHPMAASAHYPGIAKSIITAKHNEKYHVVES